MKATIHVEHTSQKTKESSEVSFVASRPECCKGFSKLINGTHQSYVYAHRKPRLDSLLEMMVRTNGSF